VPDDQFCPTFPTYLLLQDPTHDGDGRVTGFDGVLTTTLGAPAEGHECVPLFENENDARLYMSRLRTATRQRFHLVRIGTASELASMLQQLLDGGVADYVTDGAVDATPGGPIKVSSIADALKDLRSA
jgi:hypothetical protein